MFADAGLDCSFHNAIITCFPNQEHRAAKIDPHDVFLYVPEIYKGVFTSLEIQVIGCHAAPFWSL